ncbi:GTPase HflX [Sulfuriroseicoccus oceanibius]|uniref:GTPase HflX n=2 Tax=Sulfuriroseicoccus oceanibius TaxID=2707525 RepID=A0A6B3LER7_9BACT|nr:GTPase HflX [Sulfuriroseicoccus oceanibius]
MFEVRERPQMVERALLVHVYQHRRDEEESQSLLEELGELVKTLGIGVVDSVLVRAPKTTARYLMGSGKADEIMTHAHALDCDCIVFDNEISPAQQRAWEEESKICVIDRQEVILDIFAQRAQTKEATLQVSLARMQYALPRMARMWTHLDRQGGGSGGGKGGAGAARGEGEKQIEVDKRLARERIARVKAELEDVRKIRMTQRKERMKTPVPVAAIVGYTNAGKSSLLNLMTDSDVLAENKLFATLDTTTRRIELPDGQPLLLTDTVGFVRNLPHRLVEAFKATLEEATLADFLVHVVDASSAEAKKHGRTTIEVLTELGAEEKQIITVLNKIDCVEDQDRLNELKSEFPNAVLMSVKEHIGVDDLVARMNQMLHDRVVRADYRVPAYRGDIIARLHSDAKVLKLDYDEADAVITAVVPKQLESFFDEFRVR